MSAKIFDDSTLYKQSDLVPILGKSKQWFERSRWAGTGPAFVKIGRSVRYRGADLNAYLEGRTRRNTGEG